MGSKKNKRQDKGVKPDADVILGRVHGAFATQAVTDTSDRFADTNVARPSDENAKENREWVNYNKK